MAEQVSAGDEATDAAPLTVPDISQLTMVMMEQLKAAGEREKRMELLLEQFMHRDSQSSQPSTQPVRQKPVAAERPILLSTATLADFAAWKESWDDYYRCQQLDAQDRETRVASLRQALDEDLRRYIREGVINIPEVSDIDEMIRIVQAYIRRQRNALLDRIDFYNRQQQAAESFDSFLTVLKEMFAACDFGSCSLCATCKRRVCQTCKQGLARVHDDTMRDRIVIGIRDDDTRHKLLAKKDLTLDEAIQTCRAEEAASHTKSSMTGASGQSVRRLHKSNYQRQKHQFRAEESRQPDKPDKPQSPKPNKAAGTRTSSPVSKCPYCGKPQHTKSKCPAADRTCNVCHSIGHFAIVCPKNSKSHHSNPKIGRLELRSATRDSAKCTVAIDTKLTSESHSHPLEWTPDTGSDVDAVGVRQFTQIGGHLDKLDADSDSVFSATGEKLKSLGTTKAHLSVGEMSHSTLLHVYSGLNDALLSRSSLLTLGFLPEGWPRVRAIRSGTTQKSPDQTQTQLVSEFSDVFDTSKLNAMKGTPMTISLCDNAKPFQANAARPIPFAFRDQVKSQLDSMVTNDIIDPVHCAMCCQVLSLASDHSTEHNLVEFEQVDSYIAGQYI